MDNLTLELREARRRRILYFVFTLSLVASSVICVVLLFAMGNPPNRPIALGNVDKFTVGEPEDVAVKQLETTKLIPNHSTLSEDVIYVVKQPDGSYRALLGMDPVHGCFLSWKKDQRRYTGPCTNVSYDVNGVNQDSLAGGGTQPSHMVALPTSIRDNVVYIEDRIERRDIR